MNRTLNPHFSGRASRAAGALARLAVVLALVVVGSGGATSAFAASSAPVSDAASLQAVFAAASGGAATTAELTTNVTMSGELELSAGVLTLNLAGHDLTVTALTAGYEGLWVDSGASLIIVGPGAVTITGAAGGVGIAGPDGANGANGAWGAPGVGSDGYPGGDGDAGDAGGQGGFGGDGADGVYISGSLIIDGAVVTTIGGSGGIGGVGGTGGFGGNGGNGGSSGTAFSGGVGGDGGNGAIGGHGGTGGKGGLGMRNEGTMLLLNGAALPGTGASGLAGASGSTGDAGSSGTAGALPSAEHGGDGGVGGNGGAGASGGSGGAGGSGLWGGSSGAIGSDAPNVTQGLGFPANAIFWANDGSSGAFEFSAANIDEVTGVLGLINLPVRTGFNFLGWSLTTSGAVVPAGTPIAGDGQSEYYAQWSAAATDGALAETGADGAPTLLAGGTLALIGFALVALAVANKRRRTATME